MIRSHLFTTLLLTVAVFGLLQPSYGDEPKPTGSSQVQPGRSRAGSERPPRVPLPADAGAPAMPNPSAPGTTTGSSGAAAPVGGAMPPPGPSGSSFPQTAAPFSGLGGGLSGSGGGFLNMLGDQAPLTHTLQIRPPTPPGVPAPQQPPVPGRPSALPIPGAALVPSIRGFKIAENQSPQPQDRIYYSFNWFDDVNKATNARFGSPITGLQVYREILGVEKTFLDRRASIGLRMPIDTLTSNSVLRGFGGTSTSVGDLAIILKYAFYWDQQTGNLFSGGLLVSAPTGPNHFAGFNSIRSPHNAALQPYLGYIYNLGKVYLHGFSAIDVPMNPNDVTMIYNDVGLGYYLYRATEADRLITLIAPTYEVHVNTPLNHRDWYNPSSFAGTPDIVDFTYGVNIGLGRRGLASFGYVTPVTGPRPFSGEVLALLNIRF